MSSKNKPTAAASPAPSNHVAETAAPEADTGAFNDTNQIRVGDIAVTLPVRFRAGMVMTAEHAAILDAACQRQFSNNQNALAKARAKKWEEAKTDAERANYAPLTADQIAALYTDYLPAVGSGGGRVPPMERIRKECAWDVLCAVVAEHNKAVAAGQPGIMPNALGKVAALPKPVPRKGKDTAEADHKAAVERYNAIKETLVAKALTAPWMADRLQAAIDAAVAKMEAEKGKDKPAASAEPQDTVAVAELF